MTGARPNSAARLSATAATAASAVDSVLPLPDAHVVGNSVGQPDDVPLVRAWTAEAVT